MPGSDSTVAAKYRVDAAEGDRTEADDSDDDSRAIGAGRPAAANVSREGGAVSAAGTNGASNGAAGAQARGAAAAATNSAAKRDDETGAVGAGAAVRVGGPRSARALRIKQLDEVAAMDGASREHGHGPVPPTPVGAMDALHHALYHKRPASDVRRVLGEREAECRVPDEDGRLPLHIGLLHDADPEVIEVLVDKFPESAGQPDGNAVLPVHMAIQSRAPRRSLTAILKAHPASASAMTRLGQLPLHAACRLGASWDVIAALMEAYPEASAKQDEREGNFPLHWYVHGRTAKHCQKEVVAGLIKACPEAVTYENHRGNLPLKIAVSYEAPLEAVRPLVNAFPQAVDVVDPIFGDTLIHVAVASRSPADVVSFLLEDSEELARTKNSKGMLPYHVAQERGADKSVMDALLDAYPGAVDEVNPHAGERTAGGVLDIDAAVPDELGRAAALPRQTSGMSETDERRLRVIRRRATTPGCYCKCVIM